MTQVNLSGHCIALLLIFHVSFSFTSKRVIELTQSCQCVAIAVNTKEKDRREKNPSEMTHISRWCCSDTSDKFSPFIGHVLHLQPFYIWFTLIIFCSSDFHQSHHLILDELIETKIKQLKNEQSNAAEGICWDFTAGAKKWHRKKRNNFWNLLGL